MTGISQIAEHLKSSVTFGARQDREDIQKIIHLRLKDTPEELYKRAPCFLTEVGSLIYKRNSVILSTQIPHTEALTDLNIGASPTVSPTVAFVLQVIPSKTNINLEISSTLHISIPSRYRTKRHQQLAPSVGI